MFAYVSNRIPEITDELYRIDDAMKAGFGWEHGPFQIWDAIGVEKGVEIMKAEGLTPADWVTRYVSIRKRLASTLLKMVQLIVMIFLAKSQEKIPGQDSFIILDNIRKTTKF